MRLLDQYGHPFPGEPDALTHLLELARDRYEEHSRQETEKLGRIREMFLVLYGPDGQPLDLGQDIEWNPFGKFFRVEDHD